MLSLTKVYMRWLYYSLQLHINYNDLNKNIPTPYQLEETDNRVQSTGKCDIKEEILKVKKLQRYKISKSEYKLFLNPKLTTELYVLEIRDTRKI